MFLISPCFPGRPNQTRSRRLLYDLILDEYERDGIVLVKPPGDTQINANWPNLACDDALAEMNELLEQMTEPNPF